MKTSKYRAVKTVVNGITFDSKKEAAYYNTLLLLKRAGEITKIDLQPEFKYMMACFHIDDFAAPVLTKAYSFF